MIIKQKTTLFKEKCVRIEITMLKMHLWDGKSFFLRLKLSFVVPEMHFQHGYLLIDRIFIKDLIIIV